ncbi:unnamed protein product, partial [Coregonus sp. 'balchen']
MPCGNLETIHHRALVLTQLRKCLDSQKAFECMRKLRINLNLIYDHNPKVELKEEDTTTTMYPYPLNTTGQSAPGACGKKVDIVCDALHCTMESMDQHKYCLSILKSHVKKTVPELEVALQKVHELQVNPPSAANAVSAEEALKYLLFLVNVNELYEHTLGTYDVDLVLMVAENYYDEAIAAETLMNVHCKWRKGRYLNVFSCVLKKMNCLFPSQTFKDPKEYLPLLNMLKTLEPNYQRYTIDKHLKRNRKALHHLSKCGEEHFNEALNLVKDQRLYSEALGRYPTDSPQYKALSCAYAEYMVEQQQAEQAGLLLWRCGEAVRALQAFVGSASWRNALCKLIALRRYTEAAILLEQYAKDCEEAISALVTGAVWEEALRLVYLYNRQDIIETNLKPALLEACSSQTTYLEAQMAMLIRHKTRLAVVWEVKEKDRLELLGKPALLTEEYRFCNSLRGFENWLVHVILTCLPLSVSPFLSLVLTLPLSFQMRMSQTVRRQSSIQRASSVMTGSHAVSKYSHSNSSRSSKNSRKAERKKPSLKEGIPLEDMDLLHALADIIHSVDKIRGEVHSLLKAMMLFQFDGQAGRLQQAYGEALQMMDAALPEVWQEGLQQSQAPISGPNSTANSIMASFQQPRPSATQETPPPPKMRNGVKWKLSIL